MLCQLHHQFEDGHTEFQSQSEINNQKELDIFLAETKKSKPLPEGAAWLLCGEGSKHFLWAAADDESEVNNETKQEQPKSK